MIVIQRATGCRRRLLSCVAVSLSARLQRLPLESCHCHQEAAKAVGSATGVARARDLPSGGFNPR